ncbi:dehydrogenase reductase SDR family member 11-like [Nesidiocoris tenuis]|uniref:Dehydrogenase reductase SDR family member 11-like n=1 Tax=Nesidiocoris tenuis TaxID=355587 RepID=A0ABN7AMJ6_9HEMI|nr:dehydrogenase reductase SDR family member 11-like [Nesidiocoris tenuis]
MGKYEGKVAVVTGANSGIGLAVSKHLLNLGFDVVAIDKDVTTLEEIGTKTNAKKLHPLRTDLSQDEEVVRAFQWVENNLESLDILVNNAGVGGVTSLLDGKYDEWRRLANVNLIAYTLCAVEAISLMRKLRTKQGQIINITSNLANHVPTFGPFHFYSATKHAAKAISEGLRQELRQIEIPIRLTSICPGLVQTSIFKSSLGETLNSAIFDKHPSITPEDVASCVEYILNTPHHVTINEIGVRPTGSEN